MNLKIYSDLSTLSLNDQTKFRLDEINKIKDYFEFEMREGEAVIKKLSKYAPALNYTDKKIIVLSETSGGISIISFTNVIGIPAVVIIPLTAGIIKKLLKETRKKKKNILKLFCLLRVNQIA